MENIGNQTADAEKNLEDSKELLLNATKNLRLAQDAFDSISQEPYTLEKTNTELNNTLEISDKDLTDVEELIPEVQAHAGSLSQRAQELDSLLTETRNTSTNAVNAANAYKHIVEAIEGAREAAETGSLAANDAKYLLRQIAEDTGKILYCLY